MSGSGVYAMATDDRNEQKEEVNYLTATAEALLRAGLAARVNILTQENGGVFGWVGGERW